MRPITKYASMFAAAIAITAALPMSAAAAAMFDAFIKFGDIKGETADKGSKGPQIEVQSWSWGATAARVNKVDSLAIKKTAGPTVAPAEAPAAAAATATTANVRVAAGDVNADSRPDVITTLAKPLARGSVTLKAKAGQCVAGARYPGAVLTTPQMRYEFRDVIITECALPSLSGAGGSGDAVPTESITFNYAKIQWVTVKTPKEQ